MKKLILLLLVIQQIAICQTENSVFPEVPYTELNALAVDNDYIYTAGDCNTALISTDAGQTWTTISIEETVRNIRILPGSNGAKAVYQIKNEVMVLDANTFEFEEISSGSLFLSSGNFVSIEVDKENVYVISNQNIHMAVVGEYEWTKIADFNFDNDAVVATDMTENYLHVGTLNGLLMRVNLETNAVDMMNDFQNRIYSFDMVSDDLGYFTIQSFTYPIKTTDGGQSYTDLENLPENIGVTGYGDNVIMTINTNRIYVSTDGGQTSTYIPIPDDGTYDLVQAKYMTEDGTLYMAGRSSMVIKTEDFGASFINLNEYKRENLAGIDMHSSGTGVAVGGYSSIIKTEDGGDNWAFQDLVFGDDNNYLSAVIVLSQNKYLVTGSNALAIVENDQIIATVDRGIDFLHYNAEGGYLIGLQSSNSDYSIVKSTDDGMTWESKAFLPGYSSSISQAPSGKIYIPGQDGAVYTSTDGGDTWDVEEFGDGLEIRQIAFLDDNVGIASTGLKLYMTTDGGATANLISSGYAINNLYFVSEDKIIYTTANESQTNIYESLNGGSTFTETKEFCSETLSSYIDKNNTIWLAQKGGHINKYNAGEPTSTHNIDINAVSVYPNPISSGQDINIESDENVSEVTLISFSGEIVKRMPTQSNVISTIGMNTGLYTIAVKTTQGEIKYGKLVIVE